MTASDWWTFGLGFGSGCATGATLMIVFFVYALRGVGPKF